MKLPTDIPVYGDTSYRGPCPSETAEQATFFNQLPPHLKSIALHIKNEGKRHHNQRAKLDAEGGFIKGASDVNIPGAPSFICELKRRDHTQSKWQSGQLPYLRAAQANGAFACIALGWEAAMDAVRVWQDEF